MGAPPHREGGHPQAVSASEEALGGQVEGSVRLPHAVFRPPQDVGVADGAARRSEERGVGREQAMGPRARRMGGRAAARAGCAEGVGPCIEVRGDRDGALHGHDPPQVPTGDLSVRLEASGFLMHVASSKGPIASLGLNLPGAPGEYSLASVGGPSAASPKRARRLTLELTPE